MSNVNSSYAYQLGAALGCLHMAGLIDSETIKQEFEFMRVAARDPQTLDKICEPHWRQYRDVALKHKLISVGYLFTQDESDHACHVLANCAKG